MDEFAKSDARLTELEIKISYQEELLDQLNVVVTRQQREIDFLVREVHSLRERAPESQGQIFSRPTDDLPPHY